MSTTSSEIRGTLPPYIEAALKEATERSKEISDKPYVPYPGRRHEPLSAPYRESARLASQLGVFRPELGEAEESILRGTRTFPGAKPGYMIPYEREVTSRLPKLAQRAFFDKFLPELQSKFSKPGQTGKSRHKGLSRSANFDIQPEILSQMKEARARGHQYALQGFDMDRARALESGKMLTSLGIAKQAGQLADIQALKEAGAISQEHAQRLLDQAYEQWKEEQRHPYERISQYLSILQGIPFQPTQFRRTQERPAPEPGMHRQDWRNLGMAGIGSGLSGMIGSSLFGGRGGQ